MEELGLLIFSMTVDINSNIEAYFMMWRDKINLTMKNTFQFIDIILFHWNHQLLFISTMVKTNSTANKYLIVFKGWEKRNIFSA